MQEPQTLAFGVLNGFPQCRHGGPYSESRWWNTALRFVSRKPEILSYSASIAANRSCEFVPRSIVGRREVTQRYSSSSSIGISALQRQHQSILSAGAWILAACPLERSITVDKSQFHSLTGIF